MDQADGLREMVKKSAENLDGVVATKCLSTGRHSPRVITVTSGKGGVGKTNIVGNLAIAIQQLGKRVLILDGDLGLANIDIIFGLNPAFNIKHVISGEKDLCDVIVKGPEGVLIIPAGSGVADLVHLTQGQKLNLLSEFDSLEQDIDIFLIDTGAGISSNIIYFNIAADDRVVVATPEPTSITDAYALIKVMFTKHGTKTFKLLVNMAAHAAEARSVYNNLSNAVARFLQGISLEYVGFIPRDANLEKSVRKQQPVIKLNPDSSSSKKFVELGRRLLASPSHYVADGNIKFFWKRLMNY